MAFTRKRDIWRWAVDDERERGVRDHEEREIKRIVFLKREEEHACSENGA